MGLREVRYDLAHGASRREANQVIRRWGAGLPPHAAVLEVGAGVYDHQEFFAAPLVRFNADPESRPDVIGDAHAMPIADATYDAVLCISTLEHVRDPYQVVREIYRVLRPGGRVLAWVPFYFGVHDFPIDVSRFTREGMVVLFAEAGFVDIEADAEPWSGLFHNLSNTVHFVFPRRSARRWVRILNRTLFFPVRAGFPLDRRLRLRTLYAGTALQARKL